MAYGRISAGVRRIDAAWVGGSFVGALMSWALLVLTLPAFLAVVLLAIWYVRWTRGSGWPGGLLVGLGTVSLWAVGTSSLRCVQASERICTTLLPYAPARLAVPGGWPAQATVWVLASMALLVTGALATVGNGRHGPGHVAGPRPHPTRRVNALAVVLLGLIAWFGLPLRLGDYPIPTDLWRPAISGPCAGVGLDAVVRGSPTDPRVVWLANQIAAPGLGQRPRLEAVWPVGYHARFTPGLEVVDGWGNVVLRDGDPVSGACGPRGDPLVEFVLSPPFR